MIQTLRNLECWNWSGLSHRVQRVVLAPPKPLDRMRRRGEGDGVGYQKKERVLERQGPQLSTAQGIRVWFWWLGTT